MKMAGDTYDRLALRNPLGFWKQNVCSVESPALDDALQNVGRVWAGMDVVLDYVAKEPSTGEFPKTLVLSCHRDFAYGSSREWKTLLAGAEVKEVLLDDCAHYPHLENGDAFGETMDSFLSKNDA